MVKVRIIGATGYGGIGTIECLLEHPEVEIVSVAAREETGRRISEIIPAFRGFCDLVIEDVDRSLEREADLTICSTPDRVGMSLAHRILDSGSRMIDFSGDFRFRDPGTYAEYARRIGLDTEHKSGNLLSDSVYGLTELNRDKIRRAKITGNPGCFAVACILGLAPLAENGILNEAQVVCDCKTGVSGAGKKLNSSFHYPNRYENMNAYRLTGHQHVMEIETALSERAGLAVKVTFTPQVLPLCRGILACLYVVPAQTVSEKHLIDLFTDYYRDEPFVRIATDYIPDNNLVRMTNLVAIKPTVDSRTGTVRIISHIDNLVKGQAGSAVQNLNTMFGFPETTGLPLRTTL